MATPLLYDNHNRPITYARIAVTDRCNLRCFYCMPASGIQYVPRKELLTYEEITRLARLLGEAGISKLRITGGEPFVRRDLIKLLEALTATPGIHSLHITTNGVLTAPHIPVLRQLGIGSVNLSLDTLDAARFLQITRQDDFSKVMHTLDQLLASHIPTKINAVVMENKNIEDIIPLVNLTRHHPVSVRFIEEMPFNGEGNHYQALTWTHQKIVRYLQEHFPTLEKVQDPEHATASHYRVPGYAGDIGVIAAFSRTFCGTCNRIRITAQGDLKTCLYDDGVLNLRDLMRTHSTDDVLRAALLEAFKQRPRDGFEAERLRKNQNPVSESMSTIGG